MSTSSLSDGERRTARLLVEAFNRREPSLLDDVVAPGFVDHAVPPGMSPGVESVKAFIPMLTGALPDFRYEIELEISEGDLLTTYGHASGTMTGSLFGAPPTHRHGRWEEVHIMRMATGRVVEHWDVIDQLALRRALGIPA
jgi:predicted ester cyclase